MLAHKLIDNLSQRFIDELQSIRNSQKFDIGDIDKLNFDNESLKRFSKDNLVHLPYEECFFEASIKGKPFGVLARETEKGIYALFYFIGNDGIPVGHDIQLFFCFDTRAFVGREITSREIITSGNEFFMFVYGLLQVLFFCVAISCTNTKLIETNPSEKLNKKKIKSGKCPIFSYKTLVLSMNSVDKELHGNGSSHQSPRVHLRRGHIRRLNSGKMTWVQACVVGDKCRGVVMKDYQLAHGI